MWKWIVAVFAVLALMCGGAGFFFFGTAQGKGIIESMKPKERPTEVRLASVERGSLVRIVSAPGVIEPKTKVQIGAQVSAKIVALPFREGDSVKKGDVLVRLDADDYMAALASARASLKGEEARLAGARASLAEARLDRDRVRELYDTKDVSKADLDTAESVFLRAEANVLAGEHSIEIAQANITRSQKNLEFTTIASPMDGTITKLNNEVGEQVLGTFNNVGTIIMEVAQLGVMLMKAKVDESNIAPVSANQRARVYVNAYPDRVFEGLVERVELHRQLDRDGTGFIEAEIVVTQKEGDLLRTGTTGNVEIEVETFSEVLKVPSQSVLDRRVDELPKALVDAGTNLDKDKVFARVVYTIEDGKAHAVPVQIGSSDLTHTVILAGLNEGVKVISGPYRILVGLKNDQKVVEEGTLKKEEEAKKKTQTASTAGAGGGT